MAPFVVLMLYLAVVSQHYVAALQRLFSWSA